ncbi:hypothetical protein [Bacillus hominis]|uniref:hypothetical protein n=1 Tax=Bacillus hominis TaxID=2817478 RepID=UPI001BB3CF42|nr:hypothetical protein [Bacillus hominis]
MTEFTGKLPVWNAEGIEPPISKVEGGWKIDERPPAEYMNYMQNTTYEAIKELQDNAFHKLDVGNLSELQTTKKDNLVEAINEAKNSGMTQQQAQDLADAKTDATTAKQKAEAATNQIEELTGNVRSLTLKPLFLELFATMGRYGTGTPSGVSNYPGGNYVCGITGQAGDSFVTVTGGDISHGGGSWVAVIQDDNLNISMNRVTGISGNTFILLEPLKGNITNGKIGNLHDAPLGMHYTELGYYAFAQYIYKASPKHSERLKNITQFLGSDLSGFWKLTTSFSKYNNITNIDNTNKTLQLLGGNHLVLNLASASHGAEFELKPVDKGYIEIFISSKNPSTLDYLNKGNVVKSVPINEVLQRVTLDFNPGDDIKVKVYDVNASGSSVNSLRIGNTTMYINETKKDKLINANDKLVYIGDSWGVYHNKATTREITRLMKADGGNPTVLDFSKGGHTSTYALSWFQEYVINNKPDTVVIEYFTNDFNSIGGTNVGTFTAPDGTQKDMNISSLSQYASNINKMIELAITNGIQPIIVMPTSTDSISRTQSVSNLTKDLWLGVSQEKKKISTLEVETTTIRQSGSSSVGNKLQIIATEVNSATREGFVIDSSENLTNAYISVWKNNGVKKSGMRHDGTMDINQVKQSPFYGTQAATGANRGLIYHFDGQGGTTKQDDELRIVIQKADGTFVTKKIQLID